MKKIFSYILGVINLENRLKATQAGFTLVEMLVTLLIISIISGAAYSMFASLNRSYTTQSVASAVQQRVLDPLLTGGIGVVSATPTAFRFTADKNMDGDTNDAAEDVTYSVAGGNLQLIDDQGTDILSQYVTNSSFTYFDEDGVVTTNIPDIRSVEIIMTIREPSGGGKWVSRTFTTQVRCRNLGL
jgi:prepilin-type N-terminal cleavage/methylation domain-containing protein